MRNIYTYLLFVFASLALAMPNSAQEAMNVMSDEINISSTQLENLKNITFSDTQMLIHLTGDSVVKHDFSKFDNVIFGEYIPFVGIDEMSSENSSFEAYLSEYKILTVESSANINALQLVDLSGKAIKVDLSGTTSNRLSVSVESLNSGVYIVLANTENGVKTSKIIIK
jgi:hypothetical protein